MTAPSLHMLEHVQLRSGTTEEYLEGFRRDYLPMTNGRGLELVSVLRSPTGTGEEELVFLWRVESWQHYAAFRTFFQFDNEPTATNWVEFAQRLRVGGRRRLFDGIDLIQT